MKYLLAGKNGQLAQAFIKRFEQASIEYAAPDETRLDITSRDRVAAIVAEVKPDVIVNCAAYNLVDKAETAPDAAMAVNASGPAILAEVAAEKGIRLVHFGSDYVFDGRKETGLYTEDDAPNPLNQYGRSKLAGEDAALAGSVHNLVLRLSWVFGAGSQNFVYKLRQWAAASEYLKIACDEFSVPTYTGTVVDATLKALDSGLQGRFHLTNSGYCSRYEWARCICGSLGIDKFIRPVSMDSFQLPARRPRFSSMSNAALADALDIELPGWEEATRSFLKDGGMA